MKKILKYIVFSFTLYLNGQITSEKINSSYLNEQRYVDIYLPDNLSENIIKTPLIVLLEGNELFDIVVSNPPFYKWFEDGVTNTCYNALDLHVDQGKGEKLAIIYDSPITGSKENITYNKLKEKVALFAGALKKQGVSKGDRVIIYMPMIPEAVVAMLGCGRIGAVHSVVFGGFAANELASRIDDSKANILVTASCGYEPGRTVHYKPLVLSLIHI